MSPQAQVLMPDAQPRASTRGKFMVAALFFVVIAVFYFFDLMAYVSLDVPKANRNKLLAFTAEHLRILDEASRIVSPSISTRRRWFGHSSMAGCEIRFWFRHRVIPHGRARAVYLRAKTHNNILMEVAMCMKIWVMSVGRVDGLARRRMVQHQS